MLPCNFSGHCLLGDAMYVQTRPLLLSPHLQAGNVLLIGEIWDALINPVIGTLSDQLTTRFGRRRVRRIRGSSRFLVLDS